MPVPRSIYNATLTFGLVNVPVKLYSATQSKTVRFRQVHVTDGAPIEHRRFDPTTGEEVDYADVVKGYEVSDGEYVELTKDEIAAAAGERTREIPLEDFVCAEEIDPVFYDKTYYLGAREKGEDAYRVLREAMVRTGRAAIGRMTFHNREYLVAVRPLDGVLALHTMRFAEEVIAGSDVEIAEPGKGPTQREVKMAAALTEALAAAWEPEKLEDTYRERVIEMIEAKAKGKQVVRTEPDAPPEESDLLAALEASVKGAKG